LKNTTCGWVVVSIFFYVHPYLEKNFHFDIDWSFFRSETGHQDIAREAGIDLIITGHKHEQKAPETCW